MVKLLLYLMFPLIAGLVALTTGAVDVPVKEIFKIFSGKGDEMLTQIIMNIRLPRVLVSGLCGAALSTSGAILQGIMRNPLASPNIIGVSAGAGLGGMIVLILLPEFSALVTPVAFGSALLTTLLIYFVAWRGGAEPLRLILSGVAVSAFLGSGISSLLIFFPDRVHNVVGFMVGGFGTASWNEFNISWVYIAVALIISSLIANRLNILGLGDDSAGNLGLRVELNRFIFIALASLLAAAAVSVAGLLGFVGLIVPHAARMVVGANYKYLVPASAIFGAGLLISCDTLARVALAPVELPVGVITSFLGAPFFLYLLRYRFKHGSNKSR